MNGRQVHAIRIQLAGLSDQSFVIWPNNRDGDTVELHAWFESRERNIHEA